MLNTEVLFPKKISSPISSLLEKRGLALVSGLANETAKALVLSGILPLFSSSVIVVKTEEVAHELCAWMKFFHIDEMRLVIPSQCVDERYKNFLFTSLLSSFDLPYQKKDFGKNSGLHYTIISEDLFCAPFPDYQLLKKDALLLKKDSAIHFSSVFHELLRRGYVHGPDPYLKPGQYRRIADTIEIFPPGFSSAVRVQTEYDVVKDFFLIDPYHLSTVTPLLFSELYILPFCSEKTKSLSSQLPSTTLLAVDDLDDQEVNHSRLLRFSAFPEDLEHHVHLRYLSVLKFYTLTDFFNDLRDKLSQKWSIVIVTKRKEELSSLLEEEHLKISENSARPGSIMLCSSGNSDVLPHSLQNPDHKIALITDREIFTLKKESKQRSVQRLSLDFITSLQHGDFVVHMEHGIGCFAGVVQKEVFSVFREYLEILYAQNDKLFVPVDQADKLSKYVCEEGFEPTLTRLGTNEWKKINTKVTEEAKKIAKELLEIYAKRAKSKGFSFPSDTVLQREFDKAFAYQETPGQLKAIEDIKRDMESGQPMDRLVCGDVGFGKTEVAMRAAFKCVQGGRQVAVLTPITILADQHYRSFKKRMQNFGVRIEMLSRFRTKAQQAVILENLRKGDIDIIVGTHRLLQNDVQFFQLGLVIIDEEQRFGVQQKEKMKELRASVDMLTLTATPIPRTLNLGLHKLRDITIITTPPPGRLPIITEVRKYSDSLMRDAILKELSRDGQVYVLHNRVQTIDAFAAKLKSLIPVANIIVTHGQLPPEVLEERITAFKDGVYNVLVSSTIIENGIDLPRANTLVVNEAEKFGLSQLYQLRGRVGRSNIQAFSYFLYHSQRLHDDAKRRLKAIVEASELGSGFQISLRDLEIRGAGEILGANQSGNIQSVRVSHFLRMLKSAVDELRRGGSSAQDEEFFTTEILLPFEALLPSYYIPDEQERISVYQKLAGSENFEILQEFSHDIREEYGLYPPQVENLLGILHIKLACRNAGVIRIKVEKSHTGDEEVVLSLLPRVTAKEIMQLLSVCPLWKVSGATLRLGLAHLPTKTSAPSDILATLLVHISALCPV